MDFSAWMAISHMLEIRLSLTLAPPPLLITYYEKYHRMSPVVQIGDKQKKNCLRRVMDFSVSMAISQLQ